MKDIISISRRTDIPDFYMSETIQHFRDGYINLVNPNNQRVYRIELGDNIGCLVWWSKDFKNFLINKNYFTIFNNYFQFTINGYSDASIQALLEPGITASLEERLQQVKEISRQYKPDVINWRFDPICFWKDKFGNHDNIGDFKFISDRMAFLGVKRCTISFVNLTYDKVVTHIKQRTSGKNIMFYEKPLSEKRAIARKLALYNMMNSIKTYSCADADLCDDVVLEGHCIDGALLGSMFNLDFSSSKDAGQRSGCGCTKSKDIGSYEQKCKHGCLYCYANGVI